MQKMNKISRFFLLFISALTVSSCGAHFDINPYNGVYHLVSSTRDSDVASTELQLDFPNESKLRIDVVYQHPQTIYGENFFAYTSKSSTNNTDDSWYCWFFDDCSLSNFDLRGHHLETNKYVFWLFPNDGPEDSNIDPIDFAFSWIDQSEGTIRIIVTFQSYTATFQND